MVQYTLLPKGFINSLIISLATTGFSTVLAVFAAYGFSRFDFKLKDMSMNVLLLTRMLPAAILIIPLYTMLNAMELLDTYWGMVVVYSSINIPFSVWIMKTFFDSIPRELDEAAVIDGCGQWRAFRSVIMPLAKQGIVASAILTFFCLLE